MAPQEMTVLRETEDLWERLEERNSLQGTVGLLIEYLAIKINKNASLDIILVFSIYYRF